jgi:hypothetical protein
LFYHTNLSLDNLQDLKLPDLPTLFVSLMGLNSATYQGVKAITSAIFSINEVMPKKIQLEDEKNEVTILGSNFGTTGTVWIEHYRLLTPEEKKKIGYNALTDEEKEEKRYDAKYLEEQIKLDPENRDDNRIVVKLDSIKDKLQTRQQQ